MRRRGVRATLIDGFAHLCECFLMATGLLRDGKIVSAARLKGRMAHPYMANSTPEVQREMLDAIGAADIAGLFEQIPADHRLKRPLRLPPALSSEAALQRHLAELLAKNEN